jgi:hypothetical protein
MARLFITPRELDFISDITKEVIKDVAGQKVFYYRIREDLSNTHDIYSEATEKVFDPPIEIEALVEWNETSVTTNNFGIDVVNDVNVMVHMRDLLDKNVVLRVGDYFSYGASFYEIAQLKTISKIFGQVEHSTGYRLVGKYARQGLVSKKPLGPTLEQYTDEDAVQDTYSQQRGVETNIEGPTNDRRELVEKGILDVPLTGPRRVARDTTGSSFYGDDDT